MPCYDERPSIAAKESFARVRELQARNDKLTRMLCALCKVSTKSQINTNAELKEWWKAHQAFDRRRSKRGN